MGSRKKPKPPRATPQFIANCHFSGGAIQTLLISRLTEKFGSLSKADIAPQETPKGIYLYWLAKGIIVHVKYELNGKIDAGVYEPPEEEQDPEYVIRLQKAKKVVGEVNERLAKRRKEGKTK
jgi:hypothetical protein